MSDLPCLDVAALDKLAKLGGAKFTCEMIALYFQYVPGKLAEAHTALAAGNLRGVQLAVHPVKSSAGNVGAMIVRSLAVQIEQLALDGNGEPIPSLLRELDQAYAEAATLLEQKRRELQR